MKTRQIRVISSGDTTLTESPKLDADRTPLLVYGHNRHHGRGWTLWYHDKAARPARVVDYFIPGDLGDIELAEKWARGWLALHFGDWSWRSARVFRDSTRRQSQTRQSQTRERGSSSRSTRNGDSADPQEAGNGTGAHVINGKSKVTENRLRRIAVRGGYRLVRSRRREARVKENGGYLIVDAQTSAVVAGDISQGGMGLDEVEVWLQAKVVRRTRRVDTARSSGTRREAAGTSQAGSGKAS